MNEIRSGIMNPPQGQTRFGDAQFLQLAFHDCTGGCDGTTNINSPANARLADLVHKIEEVYQASQCKNYISKGDFMVLTNTMAMGSAIDRGSTDANRLNFGNNQEVVFRFGRPQHTDPYDGDTTEGPFPKGSSSWD